MLADHMDRGFLVVLSITRSIKDNSTVCFANEPSQSDCSKKDFLL